MIDIKQYNWEQALRNPWIYILFLGLIYVLYILRNYIRSVILAFKLQGPHSLPLIGSTHLFLNKNIYSDDLKMKYQSNPILKVWVSIIPFIVVTDPKDIQTVLGSMKHNRKSFVYILFRNFLGKGLIVSEDETWKQHRRIVHSAFNSNGLERFINIFAKYAEYLSLQFYDKLDKDINITKAINDIVYGIQSESILGLKTKGSFTTEESYTLPFKRNQQFAGYRLLRPWLLVDWIYNMTKFSEIDTKQFDDHISFVYKLLKETEESMHKNSYYIHQEENDKRPKEWASLIEYLIEIKEKYPQLTDEDIVNECCTFMLVGMESVSTAAAITIFLLANNKKWQEKCVDELNTIFNEEDDTTPISAKTLNKMKYLEMCIKETLRLYPSVPLIGRRLGEDEKIGGYVVPAGCNVFISPFAVHRLPNYYSNPDSFKPERFDPDNYDEKLHPYAYIPFSAGPRNCVGYKFAILEIKALISTILRNFILEPVKGKNTVEEKYRMTLRVQGGLWIRFKARTKTTHTKY